MKCHQCGEKFPANLAVSCSPGGQEAPGTFMVIALLSLAVGSVLVVKGVKYWPYVAFGVAGFVAVQVVVAFFDCRNSECPNCKAKARIRPWSF